MKKILVLAMVVMFAGAVCAQTQTPAKKTTKTEKSCCEKKKCDKKTDGKCCQKKDGKACAEKKTENKK